MNRIDVSRDTAVRRLLAWQAQTVTDPATPDCAEAAFTRHITTTLDWRGWVPLEVQAIWSTLSQHERLLLSYTAEQARLTCATMLGEE